MGGAVIILFFLPWLDMSPVKSIRYRPGWHKGVYAVFVVFFVLGYLGIAAAVGPSASACRRSARCSTFGFFLLMPWWSRLGEFKPVPDRVTFSPPTDAPGHNNMKKSSSPADGARLAGSPGWPTRRPPGTSSPRKGQRPGALQNGAKLFVNYCLNCHSAAYMRYNRLRDIGLTEQQIKDNLLFATDKVAMSMQGGHHRQAGQGWFGATPPDLTVIARVARRQRRLGGRLPLHLPAHLLPRRHQGHRLEQPGVPGRGMPHVLWELQGQQRRQVFEEKDPTIRPRPCTLQEGFEQLTPASCRPRLRQRRRRSGRLPAVDGRAGTRPARARLGVWVLIFLGLFTVIAWRLNAAYWKDVK